MKRGRLLQTGYATGALLTYRRADIRAPWYRIKEWDYYLVLCDTHALALTIADNGYMGLDSVSLLDFTRPWQKTVSPCSCSRAEESGCRRRRARRRCGFGKRVRPFVPPRKGRQAAARAHGKL